MEAGYITQDRSEETRQIRAVMFDVPKWANWTD